MEKVTIGLKYEDGSVRSISCQSREHISETLTCDLMFRGFIDRILDIGSNQLAHDTVSDFIEARVEQGCKHLYLYDEPDEEHNIPTWYYAYVDLPEVKFTHWRNLHKEYTDNLVKRDNTLVNRDNENQTMKNKYTEIQPSVWHIVPTNYENTGYIHVIVTADKSGNEIDDVIDISNIEDRDGVDVPVSAIPPLVERLQKIYEEYNQK